MTIQDRINQIRTAHTKFCSEKGHSQGTGKEHLIEQIASLQSQLETEKASSKYHLEHSETYRSKLREAETTIYEHHHEWWVSEVERLTEQVKGCYNHNVPTVNVKYWQGKANDYLSQLRTEEEKYSDANAENAKLKRIISEAHASFHAD